MCLARVEFIGDRENKERPPLIEVARIDVTPSRIKVTDLTGMVTEVDGEVESINFIDSVVRVKNGRTSFQETQ